jgi:hypothetical protein
LNPRGWHWKRGEGRPPDHPAAEKLTGTVECDETHLGSTPSFKGTSKRQRGTKKTPVSAAVERHAGIRRRVGADASGKTLKDANREVVDK